MSVIKSIFKIKAYLNIDLQLRSYLYSIFKSHCVQNVKVMIFNKDLLKAL